MVPEKISMTHDELFREKFSPFLSMLLYSPVAVVAEIIILMLSGYLSSNSVDFYKQVFLYPTVLMLALGLGGYFLMHWLASKKLNLP